MCQHETDCPPAGSADRQAAVVVASYPGQGWALLCNGVLVFEDTGMVLPDGRCLAPTGRG
ncbi:MULTISPECIES: DUF5999 family protein [Streptacidiphilus]|uniref:DUF5999 family protein n=1 Tax=Streptacidiphilus cavernicola TaxID=3342716 RepID=A0ABV6V0H6_9ACTN|nr:DUF5999 family protein [Streptacidiphilus jeojiense]